MRYHVLTDKGTREYMEDRHAAAKVAKAFDVAGVFDGHSGDEVAEFLSANFATYLADALGAVPAVDHAGVVSAAQKCVERIDRAARSSLPRSSAGATACAVLVLPTALVTVNVGDSRAILFGEDGAAVPLSRDHKPSDPAEIDRILRAGGFVTQPQHTDGVHRVMGRLSLSRALGDWELRPWVSATPDITVHRRGPQDRFIVVATDGVWDVLTSDEVARTVQGVLASGGTPRQALGRLLAESRRRGSGDNITIVLAHVGARPGAAKDAPL